MFTSARAASFTSEMEEVKTNEFQTRRRLRLQQVRKQSKEIARAVRERASRERARQLERESGERRADYIDRQTRLVERLERHHTGALNAVGSAHNLAAQINEEAKCDAKPHDQSKQRGKVAANEIKQLKQQELDKKKEQLDRKLIARNLANERSRLKLSQKKQSLERASGDGTKQTQEKVKNADASTALGVATQTDTGDKPDIPESEIITAQSKEKQSRMEDQWSSHNLQEWGTNNCNSEDYQNVNQIGNKSPTNENAYKRTNLFEVSEGMPESLLGQVHLASRLAETQSKPSLTLVSEFLRTRDHRLQKPTPGFHKVSDHDLHGLRETLYKARSDTQRVTSSPSRISKESVSKQSMYGLKKKHSVLHYDHATKMCRDVPVDNEKLVERVIDKDLDAYSLALRESEDLQSEVRQQGSADQQRSRTAASRERVAQEYRDTMAYLHAVSRSADNNRPIDSAYMDDYQQNKRNINHQKKLQREFEKVQAISRRKTTVASNSIVHNHNRKKSPVKNTIEPIHDLTANAKSSLNNAEILLEQIKKTVPGRQKESNTAVREQDVLRTHDRAGNTVTFDFTPSSYTYTSRNKHTPPTKEKPYSPDPDVSTRDREVNRVEIENIDLSDGTSDNTLVSNCSSDYDVIVQRHSKHKSNGTGNADVRKFIVYKIKHSPDKEAIEKVKTKVKTLKETKLQSKLEGESVVGTNDQNSSQMQSTDKSDKSDGIADDGTSHGHLSGQSISREDSSSTKRNEDTTPKKLAPDEAKKPLDWDIGAPPMQSQESSNSWGENKAQDQATQPSVSTSAATFKTATSNKSLPGGFVKVIDEAGTEAGKFFIGATNISSDNPYEVIIQLKRKDGPQNLQQDKGVQSSNTNCEYPKISEIKDCVQLPPKQYGGKCTCFIPKTPKPEAQFSSSSSTIYMSPPEMVLPKFLKPRNVDIGDENSKVTYKTSHTCKQHSYKEDQVRCNKTKHYMKTKHRKHHSTTLSEGSTGSLKPSLKPLCISKSKMNPCLCNQCKASQLNDNKKHITYQVSKCKRNPKQAQNSQREILRKYQNEFTKMLKQNINQENKALTSSFTRFRSKLSPVIQEYIKDLLQVSDGGTKNVKFSELHCSTVSTPGSSIINVPTNVDPVTEIKYEDFVQKKINEILTRNVLKNLEKQESVFKGDQQNFVTKNKTKKIPHNISDNTTIEKGLSNVPRLNFHKRRTKNKPAYRHKIKSLNISKNIQKYFKLNPQQDYKKSIKVKAFKSGTKLSSDPGLVSSDPKVPNNYLKCAKSSQNLNITHKKFAKKNSKKKLIKGTTVASIFKSATMLKRSHGAPNKSLYGNSNDEVLVSRDVSTSKHSKHENNDACSELSLAFQNVRDNQETKIRCSKTNMIQNKENINSENLFHIAQEKLQNMEKIADLTEKCTKRLSNLAKVLDQVRKKKSNIYQQILSPELCNSEDVTQKHVNSLRSTSEDEHAGICVNVIDQIKNSETASDYERNCVAVNDNKKSEILETVSCNTENRNDVIPFFADTPKPYSIAPSKDTIHNENELQNNVTKSRTKPPPALCRLNLRCEDNLVPHELSTVLEVDSPMSARNASTKLKNKTRSPTNFKNIVRNELYDGGDNAGLGEYSVDMKTPHSPFCSVDENKGQSSEKENQTFINSQKFERSNLNEFQNNILSPLAEKFSKDRGKLQIIDLKKFKEIMLKPFISFEEFAQKYNIAILEEGSKIDDGEKKINGKIYDEELSSLNSDGTLPDIISELLKRNIISEPFNFDADSNLDLNNLSSESSLSITTTPTAKKKERHVNLKTKLQDIDASDSHSLSSKNDLEKTFKELGIGWASSTLKKTKETLALSTSTSSLSSKEHSNRKHKKVVSSKKKIQNCLVPKLENISEIHSRSRSESIQAKLDSKPVVNTDLNVGEIKSTRKYSVELQTSVPFLQPLSVKEFLNNSLADKITFSPKTPTHEEEHFSSLYSTKLTTDNSFAEMRGKNKSDDDISKQNAIQRTSTPVQLFKSVTYNSSTSSYNISNGLFSNIDDISSVKNGSSSEKGELTIPNFSLKMKKSKSDSSDCVNN